MKSKIQLKIIKFGVTLAYNLSILLLFLSIFLIPAYFFRKVPRVVSIPVKITMLKGISLKLDNNDEFQHTSLEVSKGKLNVIVNSIYLNGIRLLFIVAFLFLLQLILRKLVGIVDSLEKGSPFVLANFERVKNIGNIILFMEFLRLVKTGLFFNLFTKEIKLTNAIYKIDLNLTYTFIMVFSGLILLILSEVFKKGTMLQEEIEDVVWNGKNRM